MTVARGQRPYTAPERRLTIEEVAALAHVHVMTMHQWVRAGKTPKPSRVGKRYLWRVSVIERWLDDGGVPKAKR
jgi:excisionase family DNA binding protein